MSYRDLPEQKVVFPEAPDVHSPAAGPAGGDLPHIVTACNASVGTSGTGAVDWMCRRPWVLVAVEVPLALEEASCAGRGSGG